MDLIYFNFRNSSAEDWASLMMLFIKPFLMSLGWIGMGMILFLFRWNMILWLPVCLFSTKPNFFRMVTTSRGLNEAIGDTDFGNHHILFFYRNFLINIF